MNEDQSVCPNDERLAAYIGEGMPPAERELIEKHLTHCRDCREAVADTVDDLRMQAEHEDIGEERRRGWILFMVFVAIVGVAVLIVTCWHK